MRHCWRLQLIKWEVFALCRLASAVYWAHPNGKQCRSFSTGLMCLLQVWCPLSYRKDFVVKLPRCFLSTLKWLFSDFSQNEEAKERWMERTTRKRSLCFSSARRRGKIAYWYSSTPETACFKDQSFSKSLKAMSKLLHENRSCYLKFTMRVICVPFGAEHVQSLWLPFYTYTQSHAHTHLCPVFILLHPTQIYFDMH